MDRCSHPIRVGVVGATGFIGERVVRCLLARGHDVRPIGRQGKRLQARFPELDHRVLPSPNDERADWVGLLDGLDGLVCASGVLTGPTLMDAHARLPALIAAEARAAGLAHVVLISAVGATSEAPTAFLRSKATGEEVLLRHRRPGWTVLRPSLVYGRGGASAGLFTTLARLPVRIRLNSGPLRPVCVSDLAAAVVSCLETNTPLPPVIDVVGPDLVTLNGYVCALARHFGTRPIASVPLPDQLVSWFAACAARFGTSMIGPDPLRMLRQGADGDPATLPACTGLHPLGLTEGLRLDSPEAENGVAAPAMWSFRLLRAALALLWIGSGVVSLWSYPSGLALLAQGGVGGPLADALVISGALWDLALGAMMFGRQHQARAATLQVATILVYTTLATALVPRLWLDPLGPLLKNPPLIAATLLAAFPIKR